MKTANELFKEYYDIPAANRISSTSHDYIYDYQRGLIQEVLDYIDDMYGEELNPQTIKDILNDNQ